MITFTQEYSVGVAMPLWKSGAILAAVVVSGSWLTAYSQEAPTQALTAQANPDRWPAARSPEAITDSKAETAITDLLGKMTIEQKVGQLIQADISAIRPDDLAAYPLGSILAGGNSGPYGNERADAATWNRMVEEFRTASLKAGASIPILFGMDAVHGHSNLPGATIFPHNIGLGAAHDPRLIQRIGVATAAEIAASGIEWTFAPTLAVPQDLRWGRSYEGYSSDPALVAAYGRAMTEGLQGKLVAGRPIGPRQVAATAKHYVADGGTFDGRDQGDALISEAELIERHAAGYPASINAGALTVMASFSSWNGAKHHGNASLLTDVLKGRMGFRGLVVGDWNAHGQVAGCSVTHCPQAINAGLDLFMAPDSWRGLFDSTVRDVRDGRIAIARVDDAVRRILRVKFKLGLMGPKLVKRGDITQVATPAHLALAQQAAAQSLVLLKNNGRVLPLRPGARVLVAGPGADNMAMQTGGWTISWQGTDTTAADFPKGQTIGTAIAKAVAEAGGQTTLSPEGAFTQRPDVAIVVLGESPYAEFQGDIPHLAFRAGTKEQDLIKRLRAQGIKVVVLFLSGRPMFVGDLLNQADAFVAAWLPGSQGAGVADVLVAKRNGRAKLDFTGRLPFAWPEDARSPVAKPLFPRGYGLSYRQHADVGMVNEDPRVDLATLDDHANFFRKGVVPAPWYLAMDGTVAARAVDLSAQEDGRQFVWSGAGKFSIEGVPINLVAKAEKAGALLLDWRIDKAPVDSVTLGFAGGALDVTGLVRGLPVGTIVETRIPLRCFKGAGATFEAVGAPLRVEAKEGFGVTIRTVRITEGSGELPCPVTN
jgi:beta-glucosidase